MSHQKLSIELLLQLFKVELLPTREEFDNKICLNYTFGKDKVNLKIQSDTIIIFDKHNEDTSSLLNELNIFSESCSVEEKQKLTEIKFYYCNNEFVNLELFSTINSEYVSVEPGLFVINNNIDKIFTVQDLSGLNIFQQALDMLDNAMGFINTHPRTLTFEPHMERIANKPISEDNLFKLRKNLL